MVLLVGFIAGMYIYKLVVEAETQKNLDRLNKQRKYWQYSETKNSDSIVDSRTATLYSDQSQTELRKHAPSFDKVITLFVTEHKIFINDSTVEIDSTVFIGIPRDSLLPFRLKRSRYVLVRFDSDTTMNIKLDRYTDGADIIDLKPADVILPRLRTSHRLTVIMTPATNPDSTVQMTFSTAGLKW